MILEHALLDVQAGQQVEFERAFAQARSLIAVQPGFRSMQLLRCLESANRYLLLVEWDTVEDHTEGFRSSREYDRWRELLHTFYDPFPRVEHYEQLLDQQPASRGTDRWPPWRRDGDQPRRP